MGQEACFLFCRKPFLQATFWLAICDVSSMGLAVF